MNGTGVKLKAPELKLDLPEFKLDLPEFKLGLPEFKFGAPETELDLPAFKFGAPGISSMSIDERVREHPQLRARIERLLEVVEDAAGDLCKADEAEQRVVEELRRMGQAALQAWAERQHQQQKRYWDERAGVTRKEKKDSTGIRASGRLRLKNKPIDEVVGANCCAPFAS